MRLISEFMTREPMTIGADQRLDVALAMMRAMSVRHLPVLDAGRLVGLLTDRDFGDWAHPLWPGLSDGVLREFGTH